MTTVATVYQPFHYFATTLLGFLREIGYAGWIVAEEESADAHADPVAAIRMNRAYLRTLEA